MKKLIITISISIILLILVLYYFPAPSILDLPLPDKTELYAGEGEICSTPAYNIECQGELVCATKDGRSTFEIREETGRCMNSSLIID